MSDALNATGRPILYSLCQWGEDGVYQWAQTVANSWRMSGDIYDSFDRPDSRCPCTGDEGYDCYLPGFHCSMMNILNKVSGFVDKGIPGAWNDLDMLEVGNGGMTDEEYKTHFSMWAAVKSPLLMGNDIRVLTPQSLSILTNPAVLAVSQDPLGSSAVRMWRYPVADTDRYGQGEIQMWTGTLTGGDQLVVLLNGGASARAMNASLADIFYDDGPEGSAPQVQQAWDIYDLWANRMPNATAEAILSGNSSSSAANTTTASIGQYFFNVTENSYADALARNESLLMGTMIGTVQAKGTVEAMVPSHGVAMMRLRSKGGSMRKRDEL